MEWMAHCGCRLEIDPETGEPISFNFRCEVHQRAEPVDVSGENRAMSLCRKAMAEHLGVEIGETPEPKIVGADRHARLEGPDGLVVEFTKVTLEQYLAQHERAVDRVQRA